MARRPGRHRRRRPGLRQGHRTVPPRPNIEGIPLRPRPAAPRRKALLDRHPDLRMLVSEGGATWVPFIADRIEEGYRQHAMAVRPKLKRSPREIIYSQVYASFQHDQTAVAAAQSMGYHNVMWGSDYPHMEGTFGHTQQTLHELFDGVDPALQERITVGAFAELFPDVPPLPTTPATVPAGA
ncbi:amidohydrolase family protein [Streptomyces sp. NPDC021080]|uniref:amidohydrolase family protein n=1 Tax=Streptomyces sp. NPDC021080 TaxID=3365110 RepID=UPI00379045BE